MVEREKGIRERFWLLWVGAVTAGEVVGFAVPAVAGAVTSSVSEPVRLAALVTAGAIEGAVLGYAQAAVLRRALPSLDRARWVKATATAAAVAWFLAMIPVGVADRAPAALVVVFAVPAGLAVLISIGYAQWRVLRGLVARAFWWIPGTAAAWLVALLVFTGITSPLWHPGQDAVTVALIGLLGGLAMAATMAAFSGFVVLRIVDMKESGGSR